MSIENVTALGFFGLGVMGAPMCQNLARKSGLPVYGSDTVPEALARVEAPAFHPCRTPAEVTARAEVVFLSLPSIAEVEQLVAGPGGLLENPGRLKAIVDMSTSSVRRTRELAAKVRAAGIAYLDAPVARLREAARLGTLSIMVGGTRDEFEAVLPWLSCMGSDITHCGDVGSGQVVKILNNMVVFMNVEALAEALAIGRRAGVDGELLFRIMSMGSSDSFMLRQAGMKNLAPNHFPEQTFPTVYAMKDLALALEMADEHALPAEGPRLAFDILERTRDAGYAKAYYPAMINVIDPENKNRK
jgi:3-hydroxyisobutyrate dehydrogenase-like beta-hydroxyacid dehydrogenase